MRSSTGKADSLLNDGRIDLNSNIVERSMRPQALTRKNALFAGHDDSAESWAIVASLIETCKLSGIDPYRYLADVLSRLVNLWPKDIPTNKHYDYGGRCRGVIL